MTGGACEVRVKTEGRRHGGSGWANSYAWGKCWIVGLLDCWIVGCGGAGAVALLSASLPSQKREQARRSPNASRIRCALKAGGLVI